MSQDPHADRSVSWLAVNVLCHLMVQLSIRRASASPVPGLGGFGAIVGSQLRRVDLGAGTLELLARLNKARFTDGRAQYLITDWEWFVPRGDPEERFANRQRIRASLGYRRNFNWRYELLYICTRSRNTIDEKFSTTENILNIRVKRVF